MADNYVIEMLHITKEFPGIKANDDITLQLRKGEIHALLGENGAGKSTLMSVLFGLYQPEQGTIRKTSYIFHTFLSVVEIATAPAFSAATISSFSLMSPPAIT